MFIYLAVVLIILLLRNDVLKHSVVTDRHRIEKSYLRIICFILILLAAVRGRSVGTDTISYLADYKSIHFYSFRSIIFDKYHDFPGYYVLAKTCSLFYLPVQFFFGIVELIYVGAIAKFIDRYSEDKLYSMLGFVVLDLFAFSLAGQKQTLSMAFALYYYMALVDKKYVKTGLLALAAYLCHKASLVFLAGIMIYYMRNMKLYYYYLVGIVVVSLLGTTFLWQFFLPLLGSERYSAAYMNDRGYSITTMLYYGICIVFLILFGRNYRKCCVEESRIVLGMSMLAFSFQAFALVSASAFRLSYYFIPFLIVGFPNNFSRIGNTDTKRMVNFVVGFMMIFFFVYTNRNGGSVVPYRFFWQDDLLRM